MKQIKTVIVIVLSILILLTSCNAISTEVNTDFESSSIINKEEATTNNNTTETNNIETIKTPNIEQVHYYSKGNPVQGAYPLYRSKNRVYIMQYFKKYYDIYNQEFYSLCFDPLCEHNTMSCLTQKFINMQHCIVNDYNSRIYVARGDNIFSFTIMGSDLRLEVSFSDEGKDLNSLYFLSSSSSIRNMLYYDNYIFFEHSELDVETNTSYNKLYRYDVDKSSLINLSEVNNSLYWNLSYVYGDNQIIVFMYGNDLEGKYYLCDFDGKIIKKLDNFIGGLIFDGTYFYNHGEGGHSIIKTDLEGNQEIIVQSNFSLYLYDIYDGYVYYNIIDLNPFFVGSYEYYDIQKKEWTNVDVTNTSHTICRVSLETKEEEIIFEGVTSDNPKDISYTVSCMFLIGDDVLMIGGAYQENEANHHEVRDKNVSLANGWSLYHFDKDNKLVFDKVLDN